MATARTLRIGDTEVARIGLGTNRLAHTRENVAFIREAVAAGVGLIDTAHLYTAGDSETTIGEGLYAETDGVVVATKGGFRPGEGRPDVLRAQIQESLRRLRTDTIQLYYLHRVDPETPLERSLGAIAEFVERGAIRHVGLSEVSVEQIERRISVVESPSGSNDTVPRVFLPSSLIQLICVSGCCSRIFASHSAVRPPTVATQWRRVSSRCSTWSTPSMKSGKSSNCVHWL